MTVTDEQLQRLIDRDAIRQLPIAYAHYMRTRNVKALVALYAPDGIFESERKTFDSGGVFEGIEAIEELINRQVGVRDPWPFTHNHFIEFVDADHALGWVYMEFRFGQENLRTTAVGVYEDKYLRLNGEWKFQERRLRTTPIPQ